MRWLIHCTHVSQALVERCKLLLLQPGTHCTPVGRAISAVGLNIFAGLPAYLRSLATIFRYSSIRWWAVQTNHHFLIAYLFDVMLKSFHCLQQGHSPNPPMASVRLNVLLLCCPYVMPNGTATGFSRSTACISRLGRRRSDASSKTFLQEHFRARRLPSRRVRRGNHIQPIMGA